MKQSSSISFSLRHRLGCPVVLAIVSVAIATAQYSPSASARTTPVHGEIDAGDAALGGALMVELYDTGRQSVVERATLSASGSFGFPQVPEGRYELRVANMAGTTLSRSFVDVHSSSGPLRIQLPRREAPRPVSGTVALKQLQNPPPEKALRAFAEAREYSASGNREKAMEQLRKGIRIHPAYTEAYSNLGAHYARLGNFDQAIQNFQTAIDIGPPSAITLTNMSSVLFAASRGTEAERRVREALEVDKDYKSGHFLLGRILAPQVGREAEAIEHLRLAQDAIPEAYVVIAEIQTNLGQMRDAVVSLQAYLASGPKPNEAKVQSWIAKLDRMQMDQTAASTTGVRPR